MNLRASTGFGQMLLSVVRSPENKNEFRGAGGTKSKDIVGQTTMRANVVKDSPKGDFEFWHIKMDGESGHNRFAYIGILGQHDSTCSMG